MNLLLFNLKTDADDSVLGFTTEWINALAVRCNRVVVITMHAGRLAVADNVTVYSVGKEKGYSELRRLLEFYKLLGRVLRTENIDACFAHMMPLFAVLGWALLRSRKIPIVLWYAHSHVSVLLRLATKLVDRVVASSPSGFRINTPKFRSIGQGIDVDRFAPLNHRLPKQRFVLLTIGRISRVKRLEVVIEAIAMLPAEIKQKIEMRFVGDPLGSSAEDYARALRQRVIDLGLDGVVSFDAALPFRQVQESYQAADIFINSSDTDSIDKTVLEAMSCGLPVITSNAAFIDVFGEELAEYWVIPKEDLVTLSNRIVELATADKDERVRLGHRFRQIVELNHSLPALVDRLLHQLESCREIA